MNTHTHTLRAWAALLSCTLTAWPAARGHAQHTQDTPPNEPVPAGAEVAPEGPPDAPADGPANAPVDPTQQSPSPAAEPSAPHAADAFESRRVAHRPLMQAPSTGETLSFTVAHPEQAGQVVVLVRPPGSTDAPHEIPVAMTSAGFVARLLPEHLDVGGVEYWVVLRDDATGRERPVFASEADPQPVVVIEPRRLRMEREALAQREGRRNTFRLGGEVVQLGPNDGYYLRATASYAHHFLTALETIEVGVGVTRAMVDGPNDPGVDYGRADLTLRLHSRLRVRVAMALGFSEQGFTLGGGGYALFGAPFATQVEIGGEYLVDVGYLAKVRLGFNTVPHFPLGATIEVTNFPLDGDANVRLLLDGAYRFAPDTYVKLKVGYRGQQATRGGVSVGLEAGYSF